MAHKLTTLIFIVFTQISLAQTITVNDTDFSKGKLGHIQTIVLEDVSKFHGHLCDGLVEGFIALQLGLNELYPDGVVDRTNTRIVCQTSPCIADAGQYISGGRQQYNTFYIDETIEGFYIVQRIDDLKTIGIKRKANVKPALIDELGTKAIKGELDACQLEDLKILEEDYSKYLKQSKADDLFEITEVSNFLWIPKSSTFIKTDILNKDKRSCPTPSKTKN